MKSEELYDAFRADVVDEEKDYLWSDDEVWRYMNDAYRMFVRLIGGISDVSSDLTLVDVVEGEATAEVSSLILKFRSAELVSTGRDVKIINHTDLPLNDTDDYGTTRLYLRDRTAGPVVAMVIGEERNLVRWVRVPQVADQVQLTVYRLPLIQLNGEGKTPSEIGEEHHESLLLWMKYRAYSKQDAETFDRGRRDSNKKEFEDYCEFAKNEMERYKSKVRTVAYGGL
jgi:hypothetical protein